MKLLFVTAQWDPEDIDSGSGVEYQAYKVLRGQFEEIQVVGPFIIQISIFERGFRRIFDSIFTKRFIKFYPSYLRYSNAIVQKQIKNFQPDVIFAKASIPLVNVDIPVPFVYMCDSAVKWVKDNWPPFSKIGMEIMERWERKVINKATHIITFSEANAKVLKDYYHKRADQVTVHPIPAAIPIEMTGFCDKSISVDSDIKLLLVGKEYHRKGVDIAIETTRILINRGVHTKLRVVGQDGVDTANTKFMGLYSKNIPDELDAYINNYKWAYFMIFPSRFDAAGIVPSEAAAFGLPTITNDTGGLRTTVEDGVSGIVLPKQSPPNAYADVVESYINSPVAYEKLRLSTYKRYQEKLNWEALGQKIIAIIQDSAHR